nr:hypothetical protein [Tanacetum cinerariifolium]
MICMMLIRRSVRLIRRRRLRRFEGSSRSIDIAPANAPIRTIPLMKSKTSLVANHDEPKHLNGMVFFKDTCRGHYCLDRTKRLDPQQVYVLLADREEKKGSHKEGRPLFAPVELCYVVLYWFMIRKQRV